MALKIFKSILVLTLFLSLKTMGFAKEEKINPQSPAIVAQADEPKEETREKTLDGEIAGVSPNFIAIDYGQDQKTSYEMTFNITKDTRLERIKNIKDLKPGDTVWVSYNETVIKKGKEIRIMERVLKVLRLLNSAKAIVEPVVETVNNVVDNAVENKE